MNAETFNRLHPVGTPVLAYPGARPDDPVSIAFRERAAGGRVFKGVDKDPCTRLVTRTRSEAQVLGGHTDVVWVDGHSACIALDHVDVVSEAEWKEAQTAAAVAALGALPMPVGGAGGEATAETNATLLSDGRLAEIKSLLRYETSISFHSARAKESMLLLVAEVERQGTELAAVRSERDEWRRRLDATARLAGRLENENARLRAEGGETR